MINSSKAFKFLTNRANRIKDFFLNLLFPPLCVNCQKEGEYLCPDCTSLINIATYQYCPYCRPPKIVFDSQTCGSCKRTGKNLSGLFNATSYQDFIIKKAISQFKYEPFVKNLARPFALLIIKYFKLLENKPDFTDYIIIPVPLAKKRLKWRGFNQAEEIAKHLADFLNIPLINNSLFRVKETAPQIELSGKEREKNIKGAFIYKKSEEIKAKKIFLVDDIYTTGSTLEECASRLRRAGAKEVWGLVVARE